MRKLQLNAAHALLALTLVCVALLAGLLLRDTGRAEITLARDPAGALPTAGQELETPAETPWPLDLNTATAAQLVELPGIGQTLAQRILDYRVREGGFASIEELLNVQGIGETRYEALKALVIVKTP